MTMRIAILITCFSAALGGLLWQYPWSIEYGMFRFGRAETLLAYVLVAMLMTAVAIGARQLVSTSLPRLRPVAAMVLNGAIAFVAFVLLALVFGPGGANIPGTRVRGIFFSEWSFVVFLMLSLPFTITATLLLNLQELWRRRTRAR
jgi:hypothetical protein